MRLEGAMGGYEHSLMKALRAVPSFATLEDHTLLAIVGDSSNLVWRRGSTVFAKGTPSDALYLVLSGAVRIIGEGDVELNVLRTGDYFGEFSLLLGSDHGNTVEAVEDSELLVIPKDSFDQLLAENPTLAASVREKAEERRRANEQLAAQAP